MEKLRIGIIGCGRIFPAHAQSIIRLDQAELVACCDTDAGALSAACNEYQVSGYSDYQEMLDKEALDAVHVCLPHYLHGEISRYALKKGVHVLCEKPMSITYEDALETVRVANEYKKMYGVIFQCRYNYAPAYVKKTLEEGRLGKVLSARSVLTWTKDAEYYLSSDWRGTWDKEGGGVVINQCIHTIDLVHWLIGDTVKNVSCSMSRRRLHEIEVEDTAEGLVTYENGARYLFYCSNNYVVSEPIEIRLCCEKGKVVLSYDEATIVYADGKTERINANSVGQTINGIKPYWGNTHVCQIEQFYNACLGKERLQISGESCLQLQKLICDIYAQGKKSL